MDSGYISSCIRFPETGKRAECRASRTNRCSVSSQAIFDAEYFAIRESDDRGNFCDHPLESEIRSGIPFDYRVQKCAFARTFRNLVSQGVERIFLGDRAKELHSDSVKWNVSQLFSLLQC